MDDYKVIPLELTEHRVPSDDRPMEHENEHEAEEQREIEEITLIPEQPITREEVPLKRFTQQKRKSDRFEET